MVFCLLVLLLFITSVNETWVTVLGNQTNRTLLYNLFSLTELVIWSAILLTNNKYLKKSIDILIISIILAVSIVEINLRNGFHSYTYRIFSMYTIIGCLYYFNSLIKTKVIVELNFNGVFWIYCGLFLFQTVFLFYLTALDFPEFVKSKDALAAFRTIFNAINIVYYLLIAWGILCLSYFRNL